MKTTVIQNDEGEPIAVEIIADAIVEIAAGMRKINATRLKRSTVVTLLAHSTKLARRDIENVLSAMDDLEREYLHPKVSKGK